MYKTCTLFIFFSVDNILTNKGFVVDRHSLQSVINIKTFNNQTVECDLKQSEETPIASVKTYMQDTKTNSTCDM